MIALADSAALIGIGWAVIHSIWQGLLAWLALHCVEMQLANRSAALRYNLTLVILLLWLASFVLTAALFASAGGMFGLAPHAAPSPIADMSLISIQASSQRSDLLSTSIWLASLAKVTPYLGLGWIVVAGLSLAIVVLANFRSVRILSADATPASARWEADFANLKNVAGVGRPILFATSEHVRAPLTFGVFRPAVLAPASFLTRFEPEEVEAALMHELGHVSRNDQLALLVQQLAISIFLFHPTAHQLVRALNEEREMACDAFASERIADGKTLGRVLGKLAIDLHAPRHSLGLNDRPSVLARRIQYLAGSPPRPNRPLRAAAAALGMFVLAIVFVPVSALSYAVSLERPVKSPMLREPRSHSGPVEDMQMVQMSVSGHTIIAKLHPDGSRWALFDGNWYDLDLQPDIARRVSERMRQNLIQGTDPGPIGATADQRQRAIDRQYVEASRALLRSRPRES